MTCHGVQLVAFQERQPNSVPVHSIEIVYLEGKN